MTDTAKTSAKTSAERRKERRSLTKPLTFLSVPQERLLLALARYRYMTAPQMIAAGVAKNASHIRADVLPPLCRRAHDNLIQYEEPPQFHATGRAPRIYALTERGAEVVAEINGCNPSEISYPVGGIQLARELEHRVAYIDACIALDNWIKADPAREIHELRHEFVKTGSNRGGSSNRLRSTCRVDIPGTRDFIIPDGLAYFHTGTRPRAVAIEIHHKSDTKQCVAQLLRHVRILENDLYSHLFGCPTASRVLSIFSDPKQVVAVMDRLREQPFFLNTLAPQKIAFNVLETVKENFGVGWVLADRSPAKIFE